MHFAQRTRGSSILARRTVYNSESDLDTSTDLPAHLIMTFSRGTRSSDALWKTPKAVSFAVLAIGLASCSRVAPNPEPRPGPRPVVVASCVIGVAQPGADTVSLATMEPVDWTHVPVPTNPAERLAFAQLYQTLIEVDCEGHARPGLAASFALDETRTRVTFSLRPDAMFWSGKPLTADDVLAAWRTTAGQSTPSSRLAREIAKGTTVIDEHTLIVSLPDTAWMVLASPTLAVYEQQATARWPEGSGPYRIADQSAQGGFVLMPVASQSAPYLVSRRVSSGDPRDAIDAGSDVLVTGDPVAVAYATARANLLVVPLPWTRTYGLALPGAASKLISQLIRSDSESAVLRESLARDAVHAQARAAQSPYWWTGAPTCRAALDSLPVRGAADHHSNRVVYHRDDGIARGLAERLVALDARSVSLGLSADEFARALRDGSELAYVLDLSRVSLSSCSDLDELWSTAPWLASDAAAKLVPLIDARETAILTRNRVSISIDWSGTPRFSRP